MGDVHCYSPLGWTVQEWLGDSSEESSRVLADIMTRREVDSGLLDQKKLVGYQTFFYRYCMIWCCLSENHHTLFINREINKNIICTWRFSCEKNDVNMDTRRSLSWFTIRKIPEVNDLPLPYLNLQRIWRGFGFRQVQVMPRRSGHR